MSDLETVLNVLLNTIEIFSLGSLFYLVLAAIILFVKGKAKIGAIFLGMAAVGGVVGFQTAQCTTSLMMLLGDDLLVQVALCCVLIPPAICVVVGYGFLPSVIAFRNHHRRKDFIVSINFLCCFVPFAWLALLLYSLKSQDIYVSKIPPKPTNRVILGAKGQSTALRVASIVNRV